MTPSKSRRRRRPRKTNNNKKIISIVALFAVVALIIVGYIMLGTDDSQNDTTPETNRVTLVTSMGNIVIELRDDMPITTDNFKNLVQQGVYDDTTFHRVINRPQSLVMIQGGNPATGSWTGGTIPSISDEFSDTSENNKNERGTIAMANRGPNTGSSQFFINGAYNSHLDNLHPVFGNVIEGMEIVDQILSIETDENDEPTTPVALITAYTD